MEMRTLRYFLEVAREENMSNAAERMHVSQSTISKQLKGLEAELGKKLFIRHSFSIALTEEGMLLRKRAEDLLSMADKITEEFSAMDDIIGGNIYFGCAESYQIRYLARVIQRFKRKYPMFHYHITSGDTEQVTEKLDKGLLDFAIIVEEPDAKKYQILQMPEADRWGVIMPAECDLAKKDAVVFEDLIGLPLFCSEQGWRADLPKWCGERLKELTLEGSFRLSYNGAVFAREGLGYLLTFEYLVDTSESSGLVFRPLVPTLETNMYIIWRKHHAFTPIAERFIQQLQADLRNGGGRDAVEKTDRKRKR
ncbi:MAG TPA: LysR family transcriptional regulator [Candidatus Anaerotignum merdipullorum]|nr:LysR family transcriptional regulator [Candidatus Anaerotignum merdipullorum]